MNNNMTVGEFRAWLEGYEHSFLDGAPDEDQWKLIKEKIVIIKSGEYNITGTPSISAVRLTNNTGIKPYQDNYSIASSVAESMST